MRIYSKQEVRKVEPRCLSLQVSARFFPALLSFVKPDEFWEETLIVLEQLVTKKYYAEATKTLRCATKTATNIYQCVCVCVCVTAYVPVRMCMCRVAVLPFITIAFRNRE